MRNENIRSIVRGAYSVQKLRIQAGNRIVANFKAKLGQEPQEKEETMDAEGKFILHQLRARYQKLMDGLKTFPRQNSYQGDELISDFTELCLVHQYVGLEREENEHFRLLGSVLKGYPIYTEFLQDIKGIGPAMAGVIVSEFDPHKSKYPSSFWKYAGLDVGENGQGLSRKKEHPIETEYVDKDGEVKTKMGITFNPWLKTKLVGVLGSSFLRAKDSYYGQVYYNYKARLENHPAHKEKTKGHRHNMATRYAVKRFLVDLLRKWRELEGLEVSSEYSEGKLGMEHAR